MLARVDDVAQPVQVTRQVARTILKRLSR